VARGQLTKDGVSGAVSACLPFIISGPEFCRPTALILHYDILTRHVFQLLSGGAGGCRCGGGGGRWWEGVGREL
jgi:hypothetical protein